MNNSVSNKPIKLNRINSPSSICLFTKIFVSNTQKILKVYVINVPTINPIPAEIK